ncbi:hypothetical protein [Microbacterium sp. str. 'China']|nr:hypothetical protein [Microbacterium sp. str. 'China']AVL96917.1 hypothetical protein C6C15_07265 [Microbacterium sp. str. 'China']
MVEDAQWKIVQDARGPWVALKDGSTWPRWVRTLDVELRAWLHGEEIAYAEYGCDLNGSLYEGNAVEADRLWAVIFTKRYVVRVQVDKTQDSRDVETPDVVLVARSSIESLSIEVVDEEPGTFGPPIVTTVSFEDIEDDIQIPAKKADWYRVDPDVRMQLLAGLRDDIWGQLD